ncbi:hypothetical protein D3C75_1168350 [compost metagenome]
MNGHLCACSFEKPLKLLRLFLSDQWIIETGTDEDRSPFKGGQVHAAQRDHRVQQHRR